METMKKGIALRIVIGVGMVLGLRSGVSAQIIPLSNFVEPTQSADRAKPGEEEQYGKASQALNDNKFSEATALFDSVAKMRGRRAEGALYWKAYAQNKQGMRNEALTTIAELRKSYPQSRWLKEAGALEIEINGSQGRAPNPDSESDDDLKLLALNALMQSNEERAIPMLEKFLNGNSSAKLKDRALFVLSQSGSPKAKEVLGQIARGQQHPDLQKKALHNLGIDGSDASRQILQDIYNSSKDADIKKEVLHSFMVSGDTERVFAIARQEPSSDMKKEAVHELGVMGAASQLRQLYKETTSPEVRGEILHSMGVGGDVDGLIEVSKSEADPKLKGDAIHSLGISGGQKASAALVSMYGAQTDIGTKKQIIHSLFIQGDAHDMVALARQENNMELKKELVHNISLMGSREGNDYMMEILNK
jgi:hypothetical protein